MATAARKKFTPRRVRSEEDRNKGRGGFITLKKTNDAFRGYALFVADPERDDNDGYYEYFEHYTPATGYVPCVEADDQECPLCESGDNASTRAKTVWLVVDKDNLDPSEGEVKIFNLNYYMIQDFAEDGAGMLGTLYSVKRLEGNGKYAIRPKPEKLTKTQLKAALKDLPDLEKIVTGQAAKAMEEMDVEGAMEENDEPEETTDKKGKSAARKGKAKDAEPEDETFDPEEETEFEDKVVTIVKVNKSKNIVTVEFDGLDGTLDLYGTDDADLRELVKGEVITVSAEKDSDDDFVVSEFEQGGDGGTGDGDVPDSLDEVVMIKTIDTANEIMVIETEAGDEVELYFLGDGEDDNGREWSELDFDDYKEGEQVKVVAAKDGEGDLLASAFPEAVKKGKSAGKSSGGKKSSSKKK